MTNDLLNAMKKTALALTAIVWATVQIPSYAEDLDTCLINGLKGVSSDMAAKMVRQACENRVGAQRKQQLAAKYGERVDVELDHMQTVYDRAISASKVTFAVKNNSQQTVLYAELGMSAPTGKGDCPWTHTRKWLYQVKIKPDATALLVVPDGASLFDKAGRTCMTARAVRAREPSLLDISFGVVEPLSDRQVEVVNQELGERYTLSELPKQDIFQLAFDRALDLAGPKPRGGGNAR